MVTIRDGIKIGFGLLLFKWIIGMVGCGALVAGLFVFGAMGNKKTEPAMTLRDVHQLERDMRRTAEREMRARPQTAISFQKGCIVRSGPTRDSERVGRVRPGEQVEFVARKGRWKRIKLSSGSTGWVGCN